MSTHDTTAQVRGVSWCAKNQNHTCTHGTCFKSTTGLPVPVLNPMCGGCVTKKIMRQKVYTWLTQPYLVVSQCDTLNLLKK